METETPDQNQDRVTLTQAEFAKAVGLSLTTLWSLRKRACYRISSVASACSFHRITSHNFLPALNGIQRLHRWTTADLMRATAWATTIKSDASGGYFAKTGPGSFFLRVRAGLEIRRCPGKRADCWPTCRVCTHRLV